MALPVNYTFDTQTLTGYSPSVGGTPVAAYFRVPYRCQIIKVGSVLGGAITTANASCAAALNGGSAFATITVPFSGSAAGQVNTATPTAVTFANEDDYIAITPSGASGASIPAQFTVTIQMV